MLGHPVVDTGNRPVRRSVRILCGHLIDLHKGEFSMRKPLLILLGAAALTTLAASPLLAGTREIKFVNKTGQAVDDLHIEYKQGVTINSMAPFPNDKGVAGGNTHNFYGATINPDPAGPAPTSATIKATSGGTGPTISRWWWTSGGTALQDGARVGDIHNGDDGKGTMSCLGPNATGNGQVQVTVDGNSNVFMTTAGHTPAQTAAAFKAFLDTFVAAGPFPQIYSEVYSSTHVLYYSNVQGDPTRVVQVTILSGDATQTLHVGPEIPTLTEWGLIALLLLVVASGAWMIMKRRPMMAA